MPAPLRIGVLGAARITPMALIRPARQVPEATIVAVAARDRGRAEAFARKHGIARVADSYDALIADPDVDAIYNPLPNSLHASWTIKAMEAGKDVLYEKPLASNADELYAKIPIGAVRLEGQLARAGELNVDMIQVGRHEAERFHFNQADLSGRCEGATHVVTGLSVGAFVFYSGAGADIGLSGSATGTGISAGAGSTASKEVLNRDGD